MDKLKDLLTALKNNDDTYIKDVNTFWGRLLEIYNELPKDDYICKCMDYIVFNLGFYTDKEEIIKKLEEIYHNIKKIELSKEEQQIMDKNTNKILNETMINAAEIIKNACMARNGVCKGCIFNQLNSGKGDYDEFQDNNGAFSDEDDKNGESETFCEEIFGGTAPRYWITEKMNYKGD